MKNKTLALTKALFMNTFSLSGLGGRNRKRDMVMAVVILISAVSGIATVTGYYWVLAGALEDAGQIRLLPVVIVAAVTCASFITSLLQAPSFLFSFKDFDLIMPLPLKPGSILVSKLSLMYASAFIFNLGLALPGCVVFAVKTGAGLGIWGAVALLMPFMPIIPIIVGALAALPIAKIGTKFKSTNAVMLILNFILVIAALAGSFSLSTITSEKLGTGALSVEKALRFYFPASLFVESIADGRMMSAFLLALISTLALCVFIMAFSRVFARINAEMGERFSKSNFKLKKMNVSGVFEALLKKEIRFYFSSYIYVLNTGIGVIMATIFVIAVSFFGYGSVAQILELPGGDEIFVLMAAVVMAFCTGLSCTTAPSISLEGPTMWLLKTLPVEFKLIAAAKVALSMIISAPLTIVNVLVLALGTDMNALDAVLILALLLPFCLLTALTGFVANMRLPKFAWKTHTHAVKQSASVIAAMLVNCGYVLVAGVLFVVSGLSFALFSVLTSVVILCLSGVLAVYILKAGPGIFASY